jgi:predicted metal-dependent HD superfamily phosphohydrolase
MNYPSLTEEVKQHVATIFLSNLNSGYVYHDLEHTESVIKHVTEIAEHYKLSEQEIFILTTAAWFHDAGYFKGGRQDHESRSAQMAESFLKGHEVSDDDLIRSIKNCIIATQFPQSPKNFLEQIICDADLFHLGTDEFFERNKLIHKEVEITQEKKIGKKEWRKLTISLLERHNYFTDYCRSILEKKKQRNLHKLLKKEHNKEEEYSSNIYMENLSKENDPVIIKHKRDEIIEPKQKHKEHGKKILIDLVNEHIAKEENEEKYSSSNEIQTKNNEPNQEAKQKKKKKPERGIDTVFRITSNNNQRLSSQADSKAHIMIQVNSIIISVLISMLFRKIEEYRYLIPPAVMLLAVNVVTITFSVLATRPQIPRGTFNKQDIDEKKVNLLFFGNFYKMTLEDYASGMLTLMDEYDFLYMSLIRDVYSQGKVLGKKYLLLRISYNVFMYGLVFSVIAFMIAFIFFSGK